MALLLFARNRAMRNADFTRILKDLQGGLGGPVNNSSHGIVHDLQRLFAVSLNDIYLVAAAAAVYAALEGTEAVGLWLSRRWAEYLTFIATIVFVPYEVYELTKSITWLKLLTLAINLLIVIYLLVAKRLFGLRGGGAAEQAERARDNGWAAIERATPGLGTPDRARAGRPGLARRLNSSLPVRNLCERLKRHTCDWICSGTSVSAPLMVPVGLCRGHPQESAPCPHAS